jgi:hypothetical protein
VQIKIDRNNLIRLLKKTQRPQTVAGKSMEQVYGCMIEISSVPEDTIYTCSLVKDGVTSVSTFREYAEEIDGEGQIPVPNINDLLGVLSMHNTPVNLTYTDGKLRIKSGGKQTTLAVSENALAFPHSPDLMKEWNEKSKRIASKFLHTNSDLEYPCPTYTKNDGEILTPIYHITISANVLYEALRCDGINGQKLNNYTLNFKEDDGLYVQVGNELKGQTESLIYEYSGFSNTQTTVNGGLENVLKHIDGEIGLSVFDFTEANMGYPVVITTPTHELIYQAANLGELNYVR